MVLIRLRSDNHAVSIIYTAFLPILKFYSIMDETKVRSWESLAFVFCSSLRRWIKNKTTSI